MHDRSRSLSFEMLGLVARTAVIVFGRRSGDHDRPGMWDDLLAVPSDRIPSSMPFFSPCSVRQSSTVVQVKAELRLRNKRFDAALNNMVQGLAMFDSEQRLVVCNKRYAELYRAGEARDDVAAVSRIALPTVMRAAGPPTIC